MNKTKNDVCWEQLFEKHKILEKVLSTGSVSISATEINKVREARLMTKFDHRSQLPKIFADNNLSILPTSRGNYIIGNFDTFCDFDTKNDVNVIKIDTPFLESLDYEDITNEATALNGAFTAKLFQDFIGEKNLTPTVSGRMSSSAFNFSINYKKDTIKIEVNNSQIEIDGGYEGDNSLILIEAKNYISNDFLIRQLYYPYKLWVNKVKKKVRPIFLTYTNGVFHLREYTFDSIDHYNSLRLIKQKKYSVQNLAINIETIQQILETVKIVREPNIPFPQADSFERVINLCELLKQRDVLTKEEITQNYDFEPRQTDYYSNAGKYLGLIDSKKIDGQIVYFLTDKGRQLFTLPIVNRQTEFLKLILSHAVFKKTLQLYFDKGNAPTKIEVVEIMKKSKLYKVDSKSTYSRRASTIVSWVNWIINQLDE
ncbi:MAG: transcriptional regulator [Bacteroidales bacterium]|jgi:hypothetical protein|nr:transcriptional regulator [Bacteroidales bacterium]